MNVHAHIPFFAIAIRLAKTVVMHVGPIMFGLWLLIFLMKSGVVPSTGPITFSLSMPTMPSAGPMVQCVTDGSTTTYYGPAKYAPKTCETPPPTP